MNRWITGLVAWKLFVCSLWLISDSRAAFSDQEEALLSFRSSLRDPHGHLSDWNASSSHSFCLWTGVTCEPEESGVVVAIHLEAMGLLGTISSEITRLTSLKNLSLPYNLVSGEIPSQLFTSLHNLTHLNLRNNSLSGYIPGSFSVSAPLRFLNLQDNNLTGGIPAELSSQVHLDYLNLQGNLELAGSIPDELCKLKNLQTLRLAFSRYVGPVPECLGELTELQELFIGKNRLSGHLPPSLSSLKKLRTLDVSKNELTGLIPPELGSLGMLEKLELWQNGFIGRLPAELGNLSQLRFFDASNNSLEGELPGELQGLKKMEDFRVYNNSFTGAFPHWLARHPNITSISLSMNKFTGELPRDLGANSVLQGLDLSENLFTGEIPPDLCRHHKLSYLVLMENRLSGEVPAGLQSCKTLVRLRLEHNKLRGGLRLLTPLLNYSSLSNNAFDGSLFIENASMVMEFDASFNKFTGTLPEEFASMTRLQRLLLADNLFTGGIPAGLGNLEQLEVLDISSNLLTGALPDSLSGLNQLAQLNLSRNGLSGGVFSLRAMPRLGILDLSHNHFSGKLPVQMCQSPALETLNIADNNLSGEVPEICTSKDLNASGNSQLCIFPSSCTGLATTTGREKRYSRVHWIIAISTSSLALVLLLLSGCFCYGVKKYDSRDVSVETEEDWSLICYQKQEVSLDDILRCVGSEKNLIPGTGNVYKGVQMRNGAEIAVKRLKTRQTGEFEAELRTLGTIRHRNIVKLLASCSNGDCHLLVYECMAMGNLADHLHTKKDHSVSLDWKARLKIIRGVAEALAYLHHDYGAPVLHRDIKCENILLDSDLEPHLADFGQAKLLDESHIASKFVGSHGYIAPECAYSLKVDEKADVYSFGIVMLELLTGKRATWRDGEADEDLVEWATKLNATGNVEDVGADEGLYLSDEDLKSYFSALEIALLCVARDPRKRLPMSVVVIRLKEISQSPPFISSIC